MANTATNTRDDIRISRETLSPEALSCLRGITDRPANSGRFHVTREAAPTAPTYKDRALLAGLAALRNGSLAGHSVVLDPTEDGALLRISFNANETRSFLIEGLLRLVQAEVFYVSEEEEQETGLAMDEAFYFGSSSYGIVLKVLGEAGVEVTNSMEATATRSTDAIQEA